MIDLGAQLLNQGHILALPTDTVYGLAVSLHQPAAIARLFELKKRSPEKALPILVSSIEMLKSLVLDIPESAMPLLMAYWPGPLTLVLPKSSKVPDLVTSGKPTVGIRMPNHDYCLALINKVGPLVVTSANISGEPSLLTAKAVKEQFKDQIKWAIETDALGQESSAVVDMSEDPPKILREGVLSAMQIYRVLPSLRD